ncbi:MAG: hypothetical protein A2010_09785 [Nitrospirae bacterium GWD2_57_9]|nr:MAG: hypothetical protein A2010_09785 [Nitrospirae bacterium GWD2_57_9]
MRQLSNNIFACLFLILLVGSCTKTTNNSYLRFEVEGKQYQMGGIGFYYSKLPTANRYHFMIDYDTQSYQKAPRGQIQWIMTSNSLEELLGKEIDLSTAANEAKAGQYADPNVSFTLEKEDINVYPPLTSEGNNLIIKINNIDSNYIEGSFSGSNLDYLSMSDNTSKSVNISGSFRAKIYRKDR